MDIKELKKLTSYCRKQGILTLKTPEIEITLSPQALFPTTKPNEDHSDPISEGQLSDEDMLFWSSAGIPDVKDSN
jgi:hypothetical protein